MAAALRQRAAGAADEGGGQQAAAARAGQGEAASTDVGLVSTTRKRCFGSGYWSFYVPGRGFVSFLSPSWGCVSTLSGLRFILFAFLLSGLTSPLLPPSDRASSESPPGSQIWDSNRSPFGFVLTNPALFDGARPLHGSGREAARGGDGGLGEPHRPHLQHLGFSGRVHCERCRAG